MSKERSETLKRSKYCCEVCGIKQTRVKGKEVKLEVHHKKGITNWDKIINLIFDELLTHPDNLQALCKNCHDNITYKREANINYDGTTNNGTEKTTLPKYRFR